MPSTSLVHAACLTHVILLDFIKLITQGAPGGKVNILGGHSFGHCKQKVCMYKCLIPKGFRHRDISLYSSKIVDKKEILRTVSNAGIYCSSDKVGTVYLV
jgi:hypothetical protein